jgi:hypothetical protein
MDQGRHRYSLSIVAITVLGLLYRLWDVDTMHMYFDELAVWINVLGDDAATAEGAGLKILLSWVTAWSGEADPQRWRLVLVVISSMAIPVVAALARRLGGPTAGLIAAVLFAASPLAWHYAPQIRPYGIYLLFTALLYERFLVSHERDRWREWVWYGVALFLCCMTHLVTALIAVPLGVVSVASLVTARGRAPDGPWRAGRFLRFVAVSVVAGGGGILWWFTRTPSATMSVIAGRYPDGVLLFLQDALLALGPRVAYPAGVSGAAVPALVLFGLATLGCAVSRRSHPEASALFGLCFIFTLVVQFFTLGDKASWSWARYIVHLLPFYLALVAVAVAWLADRAADTLRPVSPGWMQRHVRPTASVALGMVALLMFLPGWTSQSRAQMELASGDGYPDQSDLVLKSQAQLSGVIVLPYALGTAVDARSLAGFYVHKRDTLPTFTMERHELHEVSLGEAVFPFQPMPRLGPPLHAMPPDGTYAILGGEPLESCSQLTPVHLQGLIESRDAMERPGLFCRLTFEGGNLTPVHVVVGDVAAITGYRVRDMYYLPGDRMELSVRWLPVATSLVEHRVVIELQDSDGTPFATHYVGVDDGDDRPMHWRTGRPFLGTYEIQIPDAMTPTSEVWLVVGLIRSGLGGRLPLGGGVSERGRLGAVRISAQGCGPREDARAGTRRLTDAALHAAVRDRLARDEIAGSLKIEAAVYQSVVSLCSADTSAEERARVMTLVAQIDGIERVDDQMR